MDRRGGSREIVLPVTVFSDLRRELEEHAGSLPTIHALHAVGYRNGVSAVSGFSQTSGGKDHAGEIAEEVFWSRLQDFFQRRGWGTLTRSVPHPGVGLLTSEDWAESMDSEAIEDASCSFTTGFLSGFLTELAGGPVAVLEVSCRGRGLDRCSFAFGSESVIHELYGHLLESEDLDRALASL
jgi:hypothetical protein